MNTEGKGIRRQKPEQTRRPTRSRRLSPGNGKGRKKRIKEALAGKRAKAEKEAMQKKLEEAEEALKKQKDQFLRTAAEYDNYRKRTEREKAAIYSDATAAAVLEFLPVADNLERRRWSSRSASVEDLRKGVEMVQTQLKKSAGKAGRVRDGRRRGGVQPGTAQRRIPY